MKLRIKGNSLRMRLSQTELKRFAAEGSITESINFSLDANNKLSYSLQTHHKEQLAVEFDNSQIVVFVPKALAQQWAQTDLVGFKEHLEIGNQQALFVLIEKDFQCLDDRPYEDESDNFPHPNAGQSC